MGITNKIIKFSILVLCAVTHFQCSTNSSSEKYSIVIDLTISEKVEFAIERLENSLNDKGIELVRVSKFEDVEGQNVIVVGLSPGTGYVSEFLRKGNRSVPFTAEALTIWKTKYQNKNVLVVAGHDEQGLMYALLDVAAKIEWSDQKNPLKELSGITESPGMTTRAISMYTMNRTLWESKFYDEIYWERYFDMLSENRFNSFVIIFGYENGGFLAPPYPYFFDVEDYPDVEMVGLTAQQQAKNLETLNKLIDLAHSRGIRVSVAIWDHIFRGGIQTGGVAGVENAEKEPLYGLVWGVNGENLIPYTKAALSKFIRLVPKLDGIEFRMHGESGLKHDEQEAFWSDVFKSMKAVAPDMNFVLRAKDMPESVIQAAIDEDINFRIETKYWMEQMGMPYHSTHINRQNQLDRRQSYADMLRYPQEYKMYWRLWNGGTTRILLWGNPDYARRFVESAKLYGGDAYEVTEPLATKMESMPHDMQPFDLLAPEYQYYDYEFERYWHFFQVFGRLGYNPNQSSDIWDKEFEKRFGKKTAHIIEQALHEASWILPRIVASCYPYGAFPTTRGWAEKQRLGDLHEYAKAEGSDIQQFASFDEEAQLLIHGGETAKIRPSTNSVWLQQMSDKLNALIRKAKKAAGKNRSKEFNSTITDLKILSNLALYHSRRIPAAVSYRIFEHTNDIRALEKAIEYEKKAIKAWRQIVTSAGDFYAPDLMFGIRSSYFDGLNHKLSGHWKDELDDLEADLVRLEQQRRDFVPKGDIVNAPTYRFDKNSDNSHLFCVDLERVEQNSIDKPITVQAKVTGKNEIKWVRLRYRAVNQKLDYSTLEMVPTAEKNAYQVIIPTEEIDPKFDMMYFIEVMDNQGNGKIYPDLMEETPYVIVNLK